jgi:soluble cytochrome b562
VSGKPRPARDAIALQRRWREVPKQRARDLLESFRADIGMLGDEAVRAAERGEISEAKAAALHADDLRVAHNALAVLAFLDDEVM